MKFIYLGGQYTCFMGRAFAFKKATDVTDRATIAALQKRSDFMRVDDEPQKEPQASPPPVLKRPLISLGKRR